MTMLDDVAAIMEAIRNDRRTLLVSRELEEPVTRLVEASWLSGFLAVKTSPNLSEGSVYLVDERALRADLDRPLKVEMGPTNYAPASVERVRTVGESAELGGCDASTGPPGYGRVSTWCAATEGNDRMTEPFLDHPFQPGRFDQTRCQVMLARYRCPYPPEAHPATTDGGATRQ